MFYNTGIGTFIWVLTNRKENHRKGKIQLIDARERWTPMNRSLGDKRRYLDEAAIDEVTREHGALGRHQSTSKIFDNDRLRLPPHHHLAPPAPSLPDHRGSQGPLPRHLPRTARRRAGHRRGHWAASRTMTGTRSGTKVQTIVKNLPDDVEDWANGAKGTAQKTFRDVLHRIDPEAAPVIDKHLKAEGLTTAALFPGQSLPRAEARRTERDLLGYRSPTGKRARPSSTNPTRR